MKYAVKVIVEHLMYVEANSKAMAEEMAEEAVAWFTDAVEDSPNIYDDDIIGPYVTICDLVEE